MNSTQYFTDVFRHEYMQFLVYMQTPEYRQNVKDQIEKEKVSTCFNIFFVVCCFLTPYLIGSFNHGLEVLKFCHNFFSKYFFSKQLSFWNNHL